MVLISDYLIDYLKNFSITKQFREAHRELMIKVLQRESLTSYSENDQFFGIVKKSDKIIERILR